MRILLLGAVLFVLPGIAAAGNSYTIRIDSAESWADYYLRIGLGYSVPPPSDDAEAWLTKHCDWLEDNTGHHWLPLGYSAQRGLALCYRTSPYSRREAQVLCARLVMNVAHTGERTIVCRRRSGGLKDASEQPFLRELM